MNKTANSRREFLKNAALGGAALTFVPAVGAAG
ncbi:MAG: twin-arginine translocation signal domain-containing protein, partial [Candidatus Aminicenantales bacterium]